MPMTSDAYADGRGIFYANVDVLWRVEAASALEAYREDGIVKNPDETELIPVVEIQHTGNTFICVCPRCDYCNVLPDIQHGLFLCESCEALVHAFRIRDEDSLCLRASA